jgi:hypothetical protein
MSTTMSTTDKTIIKAGRATITITGPGHAEAARRIYARTPAERAADEAARKAKRAAAWEASWSGVSAETRAALGMGPR